MSASINSDVALLTEHLTYRPAALIDDIVNSINILAFRAIDAVEAGLTRASLSDLGFKILPSATAAETDVLHSKIKHEIENGVHQLETLLEAKIDKNFDKLELWTLRNILSVPPEVRDWVRLSHYEGLDFGGMREGDGPSVESVGVQRRRLKETLKLHALLVSETAKNDATIAALKGLLGKSNQETKKEEVEGEGTEAIYPTFGFLQDRGELTGDGKHPITTTASFTISQLPALKALLQDLRPRLDVLANGNGKAGLVGEEEKSWRRERLEFVEKQTRRHLESVRGLELGEMGEVRDGEWQGEGRKLGKQEVEDLERVVGMVAGEDPGEPMDEGS
ncbi:Kinetochore-associated protein [Lachnellula subtilissima]|uniref:Kinetochore-associated protein n=1 Tax=Lachnellula subtilissima TaxID=602034 RepID=A0A8H8S1U7_9HELO|nr:Kinetochore-associated protein [Lachnellula subtilissima]